MKYVASSPLPVSVEDAFAYHERPGALQRLVPPWESVEVERSAFQGDYELWAGEEGEVRAAGGERRNGAPASCFRN